MTSKVRSTFVGAICAVALSLGLPSERAWAQVCCSKPVVVRADNEVHLADGFRTPFGVQGDVMLIRGARFREPFRVLGNTLGLAPIDWRNIDPGGVSLGYPQLRDCVTRTFLGTTYQDCATIAVRLPPYTRFSCNRDPNRCRWEIRVSNDDSSIPNFGLSDFSGVDVEQKQPNTAVAYGFEQFPAKESDEIILLGNKLDGELGGEWRIPPNAIAFSQDHCTPRPPNFEPILNNPCDPIKAFGTAQSNGRLLRVSVPDMPWSPSDNAATVALGVDPSLLLFGTFPVDPLTCELGEPEGQGNAIDNTLDLTEGGVFQVGLNSTDVGAGKILWDYTLPNGVRQEDIAEGPSVFVSPSLLAQSGLQDGDTFTLRARIGHPNVPSCSGVVAITIGEDTGPQCQVELTGQPTEPIDPTQPPPLTASVDPPENPLLIEWSATTSTEGPVNLGTGTSPSIPLSDFGAGFKEGPVTITATHPTCTSNSTTVEIIPPATCAVSITAPQDGEDPFVGDTATFEAEANSSAGPLTLSWKLELLEEDPAGRPTDQVADTFFLNSNISIAGEIAFEIQEADGTRVALNPGRLIEAEPEELKDYANHWVRLTAFVDPARNGGFECPEEDARVLFFLDPTFISGNSGTLARENPATGTAQQSNEGATNPLPEALANKLGVDPKQGCDACACPSGICTYVFNSTGDPVLIPSGRLIEKNYFAGYTTVGNDFAAVLTYDSKNANEEMMFGDWLFSHEHRIVEAGDRYIEFDGFGSSTAYEATGSGTFLGSNGATLTPNTGSIDISYVGGASATFDRVHGRVLSLSDRNDNAYTFTYDANLALDTITDPVGRTIDFTAVDGLITSMALPNGDTWQFTYTPEKRLAQVIDPLGHTTTYTHEPEGRITSETDPSGGVRQWLWTDGRVTTFIDEAASATHFAYFPEQRRTETTDSTGEKTTFEYNADGLVEKITDRNGVDQTYTWSDSGLLLSETDPLGRSTQYDYTPEGLLEGRTDNRGNTTSWTRDPNVAFETARTELDGAQTNITLDPQGNVLSRTNSEGETESWTYNSRGQVLSHTSAGGDITVHEYDAFGNRTKTTAPDGAVTTFTYDQLNRLLSTTDPQGRTTSQTYLLHRYINSTTDALGQTRQTIYDPLYRPIREVDVDGTITQTRYTTRQGQVLVAETIDALGNSTTFEYDSEGRQTAVIDARGARTQTVYDPEGRPIQTIDALGGVRTTVYNPDGTVEKTIDPLGAETRFFYDDLGRQVRTEDALGNTTETVFDDRGRVLKTIAADGAETRFEYDSLGRVLKTMDALGGVTQNVYNAEGQLAEVIDVRGNSTFFEYDSLGRQVRTIDAQGGLTQTIYNTLGQVTQTIDKEGRTTSFEYDTLGRQVTVTDPLGNVTRTAYNPDGTVATTTNANGEVTAMTYDALDRVIKVTDPLGHEVQTAYDPVGNRTALFDENGNAATFTYDLLGRITKQRDPLGNEVTHSYDAAGRRVSTTNARGQTHQLEYDALGRLTKKTLPEGEETYAYDEVGRRVFAANPSTTEIHSYDLLGRMVSKIDTAGHSATHEYDENGNITAVVDTQGRREEREYDSLNRLTRLLAPDGSELTFTYNASGQLLTKSGPGDVVTTRTYDARGRLARIEHRRASNERLLAAFDYSYDATGNRTEEVETRRRRSATTRYSYDARDQLTRAEVVSGDSSLKGYTTITYTYDPAGNRLERVVDGKIEAYSYDAANQIIERNGLPFIFDVDGNMIEEPINNKEVRRYEYDSEGNLSATWTQKLQGGPATGHKNTKGQGHTKGKGQGHEGDGDTSPARKSLQEYTYNADGLKVAVARHKGYSKSEKSVEFERRFWVGNHVVEDQTAKANGNSINARRYIIAGGVQLTLEGGEPTNLGERRGYLHDALGSTIATFDVASASALESYAYFPFGELAKGDDDEPISFTGLRREALQGGSELYAAMHRHLRPGLGRWNRRDPAGSVDGPNLYRYVRNRPLIGVDPTGNKLRVLFKTPKEKSRLRVLLEDMIAWKEGHQFVPGRRIAIGEDGVVSWLCSPPKRSNGGSGEALAWTFIRSPKTVDYTVEVVPEIRVGDRSDFLGFHNALRSGDKLSGGRIRIKSALFSMVNFADPGARVPAAARVLAHELLHAEHWAKVFGLFKEEPDFPDNFPTQAKQKELIKAGSPEFFTVKRKDNRLGWDEKYTQAEMLSRFGWDDVGLSFGSIGNR